MIIKKKNKMKVQINPWRQAREVLILMATQSLNFVMKN